MKIRSPSLLSASLAETARLNPSSMSLSLKLVGSSEAAMTLPEDAPAVNIHDWISIYTLQGLAGIFRVTNVAQNLKKQIDLTLLHGIDILADSVWAAQTTFTGTKTQYLTALLNQQTHLVNGVKPWALGTCADSTTVEKEINYDRLSELMEELVEEGGAYYFTYDMSSFPWTVNYVARPSSIASEFRLTRNVRTATVTYNDADLCTRLHLSINTKTTDSDNISSTNTLIKTYNNTSAQSSYGIVVKTADIDTDDDITATPPETHKADAWAADFLAKRAAPSVQIQIDGDELKALTNDTWDSYSVGRICQVALPAYGHTFQERVVSVTYPELLKDPEHVTVSLANTLPRFSDTIAYTRDTADRASRSARSVGRSAASAKEQEYWEQIVRYQGLALDGTGVTTLYESGIVVDPISGVKIYSLTEGVQALYAGITVNSTEIESIVQKSGINSLGVNETLYSKITQNANRIALVVTQKNGVDVVNAASIVMGINSQDKTSSSYVDISANYINMTGYVTATALDARLINVDALFAQTGYAGTIYTDSISANSSIAASTVSGTTVRAGTLKLAGDESDTTVTLKAVTIAGTGVSSFGLLGIGSTGTLAIPDAVASFGTVTSSGGQITIPYTNVGGTTGTINFNIADTAFYLGSIGIASITKNHESTNPRDYDDWSGTSIGTLTEDTYYQIKATPNAGAAQFIKFKTAASSGGQGGIASVSAGGWTWANNTYTNTVTAVANDGTSDTADVGLPTISCEVGLGTSNNATIRPYGPGSHILPTGTSLTLYLKSDDDYVYLTNANATPVVGTNVVARAANSSTGPGGISSVSLYGHSSDASDWSDWTYSASASLSDKYALIKATANNGSSYYFGLNASGVYTAGYNAAPVGIPHDTSLLTWSASSNDTNVYDGWSYVDAISTGGYKYRQYYVTASNGDTAYIKVNASSTYTAGYNAAPVGISTITRNQSSNSTSTYTGWSTNQEFSTQYQYLLFTATANDNSTRTFKINASATYVNGRNSPTIDDFDLNGNSSATAASKPTTALSKSVTTISGYKWFRLNNGSWKNLGSFSISTGATKASSLYTRIWSEDEGQYIYQQVAANKLYYRT